jgi:hypothetical protein
VDERGLAFWKDITYLKTGNSRQQKAWCILQRLQVLRVLHNYEPVLVGTIPLGIDVSASDLDVICEVHDLAGFRRLVTRAFGRQAAFSSKRKEINALPTVVAKFQDRFSGFPIEIFGQPRPVTQQNAYRHMVIEARLLDWGGEPVRQEIQALKQAGLKTEPAFARYFNLAGDPYQVLLRLSRLDPQALRQWLGNRGALSDRGLQ